MTAETAKDQKDQSLAVAMCRACLTDSNEYKPLHREGIIFGELTTLGTLLSFCSGLELNEEDLLPDNLCSQCVKDLAISYLFKKKVLESNDVLRSQLLDVEEDTDEVCKAPTKVTDKQQKRETNTKNKNEANDKQKDEEATRNCESETDLKELAEAAQMKRELEAQLYETAEEDYTEIRNDVDSEQIEHEHMDEDDDLYVVQEVAETTEIYHTTEIEEGHENDQHQEHTEEHTIVDIEEETHVQQVDEDEEEVAFEIHMTSNLDEEYHEIITSDPVSTTSQDDSKNSYGVKRNYERKLVHNYESSDSGQPSTAVKRVRNRNKSTNKTPNPDFRCKVGIIEIYKIFKVINRNVVRVYMVEYSKHSDNFLIKPTIFFVLIYLINSR